MTWRIIDVACCGDLIEPIAYPPGSDFTAAARLLLSVQPPAPSRGSEGTTMASAVSYSIR